MPALRWKPLLVAGICSGLVQVVAGVTMYAMGVYFARWSGVVSLVLLAATIVLGVRWYVMHVLDRDVTYLTALGAGLAIAVTTGLVYVTYNVVSVSFVYPHFLEDLAQARFAARQGGGLDASQAADLLASLKASTTLASVVASNLRAFCLFGAAISALAALGFRHAFRPRSRRIDRGGTTPVGALGDGMPRP